MRTDLKRIQRATESGRTAAARSEAGEGGRSKRAFFFAVAGLLLVLLGAAGIARYEKQHSTAQSAPTAAKPSVAVLPLQNLSAEPDSAYFSDGMTDEITTKLAKIEGIDVASHSRSRH